MKTRTIDVELELKCTVGFEVTEARIVEGVSTHCVAEIEVASNEDLDFDGSLAEPGILRVLVDGEEARRFTLRLSSVAFSRIEQGSRRYLVTLHDALWFLRFVTSTRKFRNTSTQDIVSAILGEGRVAASWSLERPTPVRNYCVQYRETNLDFVLRLLEFEGIYHSFDEHGTLLLADRSSASPPVAGASHFELIDSAGALAHGELGIHAFHRGRRIAPGKATVHDYDWKKPQANLIASATGDELTELEVYDYPTGYREEAEGAFLAQIRLEALRVPARRVGGESNVPALSAARMFTFGGPAGAGFAGEYLLTRVEHVYRNPVFHVAAAGAVIYGNTFCAIPRAVPFRPPLVTEQPTIAGTHTAMVRGPIGEEIHTDRFGRFKAQFHWDREASGTDADSRWIRMLQEPASSMTLARVGWEMSVAYIDGDPDRPVGISRQINGAMIPTYGLPANRNMMTIKTQTYPGGGGYNELRLDDSAESMRFEILAQRDYHGVVQNDRVQRIGNDDTHVCHAQFVHAVGRDQTVTVGGNDITSCVGLYGLAVAGSRTKSVGADETVIVVDASQNAVNGDEREEVGGDWITSADGGVLRNTKEAMRRTIGGDYVVDAGGAVKINTGSFTETVAGSKITNALGAGIQQAVMGTLTVDVAGSLLKSAGDAVTTSAQTTTLVVGGSASLSAARRVELRGQVIELVAQSSFGFTAGGLALQLTPGGVKITGTVKLDAGSKIAISGSPDQITS